MLTVEMSGDDRLTRVRLAGELDLDTTRLLSQAIERAPRSSVLEIDLASLTYCDSAGVGALVAAQQAMRGAGRSLYVINPQGLVQNVLQVSGVLNSLSDPG